MRHRVFGRERVLRNPVLETGANIQNGRFGQFGLMVLFPLPAGISSASLCGAIADVLQLRAKKQVRHIDARWIVAFVQDVFVCRDRADNRRKNNPMGHRRFPLATLGSANAHHAVPAVAFPALILNTSRLWVEFRVSKNPLVGGHKWGQFFHMLFGDKLYSRSLP